MLGSHHVHGVIEVVEQALDRRITADGERQGHHPEESVPFRQRGQLVVREVSRHVVDGPAARVTDDHRRRRRALEDLVERRLGGVGEIDDDSAGGQIVHQRTTAIGQTLVGGVEAAGEGVGDVVGEPDHAHTGVPEVREARRIVTERFHAFHREEEPDAAVRGG